MNSVLLAAALALNPMLQTEQATTRAELPPTPEEVMEIPDELRAAFHRAVVDATRFPEKRLEKLVAFVFDQKGLGVTYKSDATKTVAESFQSREVNCLSSTLLIVALAREAGLQAEGQQVDRILSWGAIGETVIQSRHANAIVQVASKRRFVVDVDASDVSATDALQPVDDQQLLAMFYGNRAMELLVVGAPSDAKPWMEEALRFAPEDPTLLNNAGVLSLRLGDIAAAESWFLRAVSRNPEQMSVVSNLVALYQGRGDEARTAVWKTRADKILRKDPYYQFTLGRQYEQAGSYSEAARQYRRAVSLNRDEHRFHFGLARVYFQLGQFRMANRELSIAEDLSAGQIRARYQDKLAALRQMRH